MPKSSTTSLQKVSNGNYSTHSILPHTSSSSVLSTFIFNGFPFLFVSFCFLLPSFVLLQQFNSIGDFSAANKCAHFNDVCSLQSPLQPTSYQHSHAHSRSDGHNHSPNQSENHSTSSTKDVSDTNYITAVQKSSFERSICDNSVISLRNYSTILHTSNHPLYKTQTPVVAKALVRQTSTPMHHNLAIADTAPTALQMQPLHTNGSSCSQCMGASTSSGQLSCINSSSDSDTSISTVTKPNDIR